MVGGAADPALAAPVGSPGSGWTEKCKLLPWQLQCTLVIQDVHRETVQVWHSWLHTVIHHTALQFQSLNSVCQHQRDLVIFICFVKLASVCKTKCWRNKYIDGVNRNEDTLGENFFLRISVFAIFRSLGTCCKGQVLTFRKLPLMNQDKNHLVQGFFFPMYELQVRGGIAQHLEIPVGGLWKWLKNWIYNLPSLLLLSSCPPMKGGEKEILVRRRTERL